MSKAQEPALDLDAIEVVDFATSSTGKSSPKPTVTKVNLVGETIKVTRPKDAVLFFAQRAVSDNANEADRYSAALNLLNGMFTPQNRHRFLERACDRNDPLNATAMWEMIGQLLERWSPDSKIPASSPVNIEAQPHSELPAPLRIVNEDLDLDVVCHPPKDLIMGITASAISVGSTLSDQAWCIGLFLDAALSRGDLMHINERLRNQNDDLDLEDVANLVQQLVERWYDAPLGNRKQRRARNAKQRRSSSAPALSGDTDTDGE